MLLLTERVDSGYHHSHTMTLDYERRQKARFRARSDSGEEMGVMLPRGSILRAGDCLRSEDGTVTVKVIAALQEVSVARSPDRLLQERACYHLGNRHVPLQIVTDCLVYQRDHVLDEMVEKLGLTVSHEMLSFEPEPGAYQNHVHSYVPAQGNSSRNAR